VIGKNLPKPARPQKTEAARYIGTQSHETSSCRLNQPRTRKERQKIKFRIIKTITD
jgi:hypothetical protein